MRKIFIVFLFIISEAAAQTTVSDSAEIHHDYQPNAWNFSLRTEYYLTKGSYFFAEGLYKASKAYYSTSEVFKEYIWIGYEQKASEKWYLGISGRGLRYANEKSFIMRVNVSHRGSLGKICFLKELSFDQVSMKSKQNYGRVGFTLGFYKAIPCGKLTMLPVLSYKAMEIFDLKNPNSFFKNRRIDLSRLRLDVYLYAKRNFYLGLYAMRETDFYYALGYSVPDPSNPSVILYSVPDYRVNRVTPVFGCSLNYILKPENNTTSIPGLPLR
jgi:hypothetical protein